MNPDQDIDPSGTSFHGVYLKCSLKKLAASMGEPIDRFCHKTNYEWRGTTDDGHIFTVYDWKRPRPQMNQLVEWHIGGKTKEATEQAKLEILQKLTAQIPKIYPKGEKMDDLNNIIHVYTAEQAIEDGVLYHPYPERWPNLLITQSIHTDCKNQKGQSYDQALVPLLMDCIMAVQANRKKEPPLVLNHTVAGTVWIMPNELGGMTVMKQQDY